jgi:hypothetical protein
VVPAPAVSPNAPPPTIVYKPVPVIVAPGGENGGGQAGDAGTPAASGGGATPAPRTAPAPAPSTRTRGS